MKLHDLQRIAADNLRRRILTVIDAAQDLTLACVGINGDTPAPDLTEAMGLAAVACSDLHAIVLDIACECAALETIAEMSREHP